MPLIAQAKQHPPPLVANVVANFPKVVANSRVEPLATIDDFFTEETKVVEDLTSGWRLEKNNNGYYRWRWQMKESSGKSITYLTKSGKTGYKRGSKYVGKIKQ